MVAATRDVGYRRRDFTAGMTTRTDTWPTVGAEVLPGIRIVVRGLAAAV